MRNKIKIILVVVIVGALFAMFARSLEAQTPFQPIQQYKIQSQGLYSNTQRSIALYEQALPSVNSMFEYAIYNGSGTLCTRQNTGTNSPYYSGNNSC
jgi:hypothetical protein